MWPTGIRVKTLLNILQETHRIAVLNMPNLSVEPLWHISKSSWIPIFSFFQADRNASLIERDSLSLLYVEHF